MGVFGIKILSLVLSWVTFNWFEPETDNQIDFCVTFPGQSHSLICLFSQLIMRHHKKSNL